MLHALNIFFFIFHTLMVLFNVFGWLWKPTRRWNLIALGATSFSWFVMGFWKGIGYCICTDWHMQIRRELGYQDTAQTYIQLLAQQLTGLTPPAQLTMTVSGIVFAISVIGSITLNIRDHMRAKTAPLGSQDVVVTSSSDPSAVQTHR